VAAPAIAALTSVTPVSRTRLQFSSRILMRKKLEWPGLVPAANGIRNRRRQEKPKSEQTLIVHL
jgi:hypothetical protein